MRTKALAAKILPRLAEGESLRTICKDEGMPSEGMVRRWAIEDEDFGAQYARARELGYEALAEDILDISDDVSRDTVTTAKGDELPNAEWISRSRLRVDSRKWLLAKMLPKKYGDSLDINANATGEVVITHRIVKSREDLNAQH